MNPNKRVLLFDDGSLRRILRLLGGLGVDVHHVEPQTHIGDFDGPFDLVFAAVNRLPGSESEFELSSVTGKPIWIAVHDQDSLALRVQLLKRGVHFLIQQSISSQALRQLLSQTLYAGPDRRDVPRIPIGTQMICRDASGVPFQAQLIDLTRDGCRFTASHPLRSGTVVGMTFPTELSGGDELALAGQIERLDSRGGSMTSVAVVLFEHLGQRTLARLDAILAGEVIGTVVTRLTSLRTSDGGDSTEPESPPEPLDRRKNRRVDYTREVTALHEGGEYPITARDLSVRGMRSEHLGGLPVGTPIELALYGPSGAEPVLVRAVVFRDDGAEGTVFHFEAMEPSEERRLEAIIESATKVRIQPER